MLEKTRLLLVDDHAIVREGYRRLLESRPDLAIVGEAASGQEGIALAKELEPDLILLDLNMKGMNGIETLREDHHALTGSVRFNLTFRRAHLRRCVVGR